MHCVFITYKDGGHNFCYGLCQLKAFFHMSQVEQFRLYSSGGYIIVGNVI